MHVSERTGSNGYRKRRRQMVIIGGKGPYSAAGGHIWRQEAILGGRGPYSAAEVYTRRQEAMLRRSKKVWKKVATGGHTRRQGVILGGM
jgi:hypothetical protein